MSLYVRQHRSGFGDTIAASFNPQAMRALVTTQTSRLMQAIQQGTSVSDPLVGDPGSYGGLFAPPAPLTDPNAVPPWVYWAGGGAMVLLVGAVAYRVKKRGRR